MATCKTLVRTSLYSLERKLRSHQRTFSSTSLPCLPSFSSHSSTLRFSSFLSPSPGLGFNPPRVHSRCYSHIEGAISLETTDFTDETVSTNLTVGPADDNSSKDTVEQLLLSNCDDAGRLLKMERRSEFCGGGKLDGRSRWFPYLDKFNAGGVYLSSGEVLGALDPYIMEVRKERFRNVVKNRSYSVCLVVEGLCDFGNVSAAFRSADALGFQSVHVVSCDSSKRCNEI